MTEPPVTYRENISIVYNYEAYAVFDYITETNVERAKLWHGQSRPWTVLEWAGAMCGEAGEAANVAKKILREELDIPNRISKELSTGLTIEQLDQMLAKEIADTFLYLNLLAANRGINMYAAIAQAFNEKSDEYGFPQKLVDYPTIQF
jgi:hypothetical protein